MRPRLQTPPTSSVAGGGPGIPVRIRYCCQLPLMGFRVGSTSNPSNRVKVGNQGESRHKSPQTRILEFRCDFYVISDRASIRAFDTGVTGGGCFKRRFLVRFCLFLGGKLEIPPSIMSVKPLDLVTQTIIPYIETSSLYTPYLQIRSWRHSIMQPIPARSDPPSLV